MGNEELAAIARSPEVAALRVMLEGLPPATLGLRNDVAYTLGTMIRLQNEFPAPVEQPAD